MEGPFRIDIANDRRTQRNRVMELKVHLEGSEEAFYATATLYGPELYLNLPASSDANAFVAWLSQHIGSPSDIPIVKCSAPWGEMMVGPMQTVIWKLEPSTVHRFDLALG